MKKYLLFVSCGRCGTTRLAEILKEKLPADRYAVVHQMHYSRLANIIGNLMYYFKGSERIKNFLYLRVIAKYQQNKNFISTDPLTAMIIPKSISASSNCYIIYIQREHDGFAKSMFSFSRKRIKSFIAHNFVPFWQLGIYPFENVLHKNIIHKYRRVSEIKEKFFLKQYEAQPNYYKLTMSELFSTNKLKQIISETVGENIQISSEELKKKSNES
jgi:hypothetical protein